MTMNLKISEHGQARSSRSTILGHLNSQTLVATAVSQFEQGSLITPFSNSLRRFGRTAVELCLDHHWSSMLREAWAAKV